mmetsp:Transcript_13377/g.20114  ORF Transcript_13377/g.20114 Transcript_13377/m.20114 type:complete len:600 (-) Transcript_13377:13-1812(-)
MRWSNIRDRADDAVVGGSTVESSSQSISCREKTGVNSHDEELIELPKSTHSDRDEGRLRFSLFRRRRTNPDVENDECERIELLSSESDQGGVHNMEMSVAAVAAVEGTSLLECSNDDISNRVDESSTHDDQSTDTKEVDSPAKFNWFGLLSKNNQTSSSCEENKRSSKSPVYHQTSAVADDDLESVDGDTTDDDEADAGSLQCDIRDSTAEVHADSAKPRFNWFGLLQPSQSESSCMENDACEIQGEHEHGLVRKDDEGEVKEEVECDDDEGDVQEEEGGDEEEVCTDYSIYAPGRESSAEVSTDENRSDDSMDTNDIVLDINDDERLQALFDKCSSDQQEEQQHSCCDDDEPRDEGDVRYDSSCHIMNNDNAESEFFVKKESPLSDEIVALWQRRQRLKRKLQIDGPIRETSAPASMKMLGTSQMEVGGGRNEENMRSLELEAHLIDTNSDRKMAKMEIMTAEEKEREDLLYDLWLQDCLLMAGEEPQDGYDNLGWYSVTTQREDGEADLEYMDTSAMHVATEDDAIVNKSNRWLDGIGNAALFIFAPDLYFIQQMNESSLQAQYHPTSNKEDGEQDSGQKQGWFKKLFTNEGRRKDQ